MSTYSQQRDFYTFQKVGNMRTNILFSALFHGSLLLTASRLAMGSYLFINAAADGPARRLDYNEQGPAIATDVLTYSDSATGTGVGMFNAPFVFHHSQAGRASFGDLGASRESSISGDYLNNPTSRGYVTVAFTDQVSFSVLSGTPVYLEVDISIDGSVFAQNYTSARVSSDTRFGNAQHYFFGGCGPTDSNGGLECGAKAGLNPANTGTPAFQDSGFTIRQTFAIPLSMMFIGPISNSFQISSTLEILVDMWMSGNLPPTSAGSVDFLNSSKLGSLRLLDANFDPLVATFTSESGYDYTRAITPSEVPEPTSMGLLICGLVLLIRRRGRSS